MCSRSDRWIARGAMRGDGLCRREAGFSLIEVVLVVLIMGILASVAAQKFTGAVEQSRFDATRAEMERLATAVVGNPDLTSGGVRSDFGYVGDVGSLPPNLDALVANPGGFSSWDGPYIQSDFQQNPNDYKQDAWGSSYGYSGGVTITSNGSGSAVTKQFAASTNALLQNTVSGTVTDGLNNPPGDSSGAVTLSIRYPNGSGNFTTGTANPTSGGTYSFSGTIPVGNHEVTLAYAGDTLKRIVSVLPGSNAYADFRLAGTPWQPTGPGPGGPAGAFTYVSGSALAFGGGNRHMRFDVANNSGADAQITSLQATYGSAIFFEQIRIDGTTKFNSTSPRGASGDVIAFAATTVANGATAQIEYRTFRTCVSGGCGLGSTSGVAFTIVFDDGSTVSFTVP